MLGHHVTLLEKTSVLCHMQHGCDTRWVHPHLYDWPSQGSERPTAGLPIMDWRAGTASSVVAQLIHQLK
ncbi:MAG TPA: hypothetical protein VG797_09855, partial [Phycisphaerales bacterium]|nr:hypothetical protein [Phycisphaerales bacterium]